jgi:glycosyltransferase involved in cell wall biosynthesis
MNVSVSVFGRLHAFYLARQLERRRALFRLYTTYPKFEVVKYGIPRARVTSWPAVELAFRTYMALPPGLRGTNRSLARFVELHDLLVSRHLSADVSLFHGWSQASERSMSRAKQLGALATLQRGSAHIEYQRDILEEEYDIQGLKGELPHRNIVAREMREYDIADYVFVPSEFARQTFLAKGFPQQKLVRVPLGVSLTDFYPTGNQDGVFRVIYAGTMSLRKGVHYLLQAFAELALPNAELWLVGTMLPEMRGFFHKYDGVFRYFGKVPQAQLRELYGRCSVFALCSIEDGFGVVLTQAMACGLPAICTTNSGGPDVLEDGQEGYAIPIRDVQTLKERALFLYHNPDAAAEMGRRARARALSALSWEDYGRQIFDSFQSCLDLRERVT